ncbi:uncharacterized protein BXZ73DRAFT_75812 [Epithele typhae]|uniref:uncharacterized protein n=1 Tax=Epithele typhae TaxID=378194 RepID=UPI002008B472|nr:uncharacterized protein BXZ73DRAFT_75812 [Epithele typhae]KAH9940224.1 hypothetical protein BXZ73DRAFT_75812 [Epithele typhae]
MAQVVPVTPPGLAVEIPSRGRDPRPIKRSLATHSDRVQARMTRQKRIEEEQEQEDREALRAIRAQREHHGLEAAFLDVRTEFSDLDGLSWESPDARQILLRWHAQQAISHEYRTPPSRSSPGNARVRRPLPRRLFEESFLDSSLSAHPPTPYSSPRPGPASSRAVHTDENTLRVSSLLYLATFSSAPSLAPPSFPPPSQVSATCSMPVLNSESTSECTPIASPIHEILAPLTSSSHRQASLGLGVPSSSTGMLPVDPSLASRRIKSLPKNRTSSALQAHLVPSDPSSEPSTPMGNDGTVNQTPEPSLSASTSTATRPPHSPTMSSPTTPGVSLPADTSTNDDTDETIRPPRAALAFGLGLGIVEEPSSPDATIRAASSMPNVRAALPTASPSPRKRPPLPEFDETELGSAVLSSPRKLMKVQHGNEGLMRDAGGGLLASSSSSSSSSSGEMRGCDLLYGFGSSAGPPIDLW